MTTVAAVKMMRLRSLTATGSGLHQAPAMCQHPRSSCSVCASALWLVPPGQSDHSMAPLSARRVPWELEPEEFMYLC